MIPYGKQSISADDIKAVKEVLESDFLTQGPAVPLFEKAITSYIGSRYGCAVNSATSALHIACLALGLEQGDILWTSPITFVASANCGLYCGADVDFVDIDPQTYNLCPEKLEQKLIEAKKLGNLPNIIVAVHMCGQSCDMKAIYKLSKIYGFKIIEDASHAIGGLYNDEKIGSCKFSDIAVFSFHPVKIVTTAEGGIAVTNSKTLMEKMKLFRSHGITRDQSSMRNQPDGDWYYEQICLGYNYRMTELQAALGNSQMTRLDDFISSRHLIKRKYDEALQGLPVTLPFQSSFAKSSLHLYVIRLNLKLLSQSHEQIFRELRKRGIGVNLHYIPIHLQPFYQDRGFKPGDFPESERYYNEAISIPIFHGMTSAQQNTVIKTLVETLAV